MTRISTVAEDDEKPRIDRSDVLAFFEERSAKIEALGPVRAVIYQDKHPDLAERRDAAEKQRIAPLLALDGSQRLLDVGCGTGRWASAIAGVCARYHGIDISPGLIEYARQSFAGSNNCAFSVASADDFSLQSIASPFGFDRLLCTGVLIYLNDDEVLNAFRCMESVMAPSSRIVMREPMGVDCRLTVRDHFSTDLDQSYNAIYRTRDELEDLLRTPILNRGFRIIDEGYVFDDADLNNRSDTRQRWAVLERSS